MYEIRCLGDEIYSTNSLDKLLAEAPAYDAECEHTHEIVLVIKPDSRQEEVTPEWSRITQALKGRDELAADVERVKAEMDAMKQTNSEMGLTIAEQGLIIRTIDTELEFLKSRLPCNADNEAPTIDNHQFMIDDEGELIEFIVDMMHKESGKIYLHGHTVGEKFGVVTPLISQCHSTAESCRAAHEKGE